MKQLISLNSNIPDDLAHQRLDQALAKIFPDYSRSRLTQWLKQDQIKIDGKTGRSKDKVKGGEHVVIHAVLEDEQWEAESIPLTIIHEDNDILVLNKPAGVVVHPAQGNFSHTIVNALLYHCPALGQLPRAGLIHRLDKDTTGLLVVAKNLVAHHALVKAMQERKIQRTYQAIVYGKTPIKGTIHTLYGRHPQQRLKMAVYAESSVSGKQAITHYKTKNFYAPFSLLEVSLETGRTHQIRVHLAHIKFPIVGDNLYGISGKQLSQSQNLSEELRETLLNFHRQTLHAWRLKLQHPVTQEWLSWAAPLPDDMQYLLELIKNQ